jgi:hypothetical protein
MTIIDFIILGVIAAILGLAAWYLYKEKKSGKKCIGCPHSAACTGKCSGCCGLNKE